MAGVFCAAVVVAALFSGGCQAVGSRGKGLSFPFFGAHRKDEAFHQRVQADPFPTAQQSGL